MTAEFISEIASHYDARSSGSPCVDLLTGLITMQQYRAMWTEWERQRGFTPPVSSPPTDWRFLPTAARNASDPTDEGPA